MGDPASLAEAPEALVGLLHEQVEFSMPPYDLWLRGPDQVAGWLLGPGWGCQGSRLVETRANGAPAFAQYRVSEAGDGHTPWALVVIETADGRITGITSFLATERLFPAFGLPARLPATQPH